MRSPFRIVPIAVSIATASLSAQDSGRPVPAPATPLAAQPVQPSFSRVGGEEMIDGIHFPNAPVADVLAFYEKLTGFKTIYDNTVQGQVNIVITKQITREEAVRIIETALLINGFTLVPGPGDIVKVLGVSKNARQFAVPIFSDVRDIPENDQVISFLFKLEYADPLEVQQIISQYVAPSPYTSFLPLPKSQALIATESSNVIRALTRVVAELDRPPAEVVSEFFTLQRADAKDVVEKLTAIFEKQPTAPGQVVLGGGGAPPPPPPGQPPGVVQNQAGNFTVTLSEDSLIIGKIKLTADVRTNRIHVVTRPINIPFIRSLIAEYDSDLTFGEPARRSLRYVSAGDVLDVIVQTLTEPKDDTRTGANAPQNANRNNQQTAGRNNASSGSGGGSGAASLRAEELATPNVDTAPESRTVGNTKIIADKRANAIIVLGSQEAKEKVFRVLNEIDVRAPQVMLTAIIGELTLNEDEEFGVDYIQSLGRSTSTTTTGGTNGSVTTTVTRPTTGIVGAARNTTIPITDLTTLATAASFAGVPSGLTAFVGVTDSLEIIVHALEATGRFRITSRPMVFTGNSKKAVIASGQEIAVPSTILSGVDTNSSTGLVNNTSVEYKDVVLKLEVVPLINSDNEVSLDIVQEVNSVSGATLIGGNSIPTISTRRVKTSVSVANEATIVLGGLVQESKEDTKSGIPVLGKIPVLGALFSTTKKAVKRTELVVLLRPTVTNGNTEAIIAGEQAQERLNLPPDLESTLDPKGYRAKPVPTPAKVKMKAVKPQPELRPFK